MATSSGIKLFLFPASLVIVLMLERRNSKQPIARVALKSIMSLCKFSHSCFCLFCRFNLMLVTSLRRERCEHSSQWLQIFLGSKRRDGITTGLSHSFTPRPPTKNIIDNSGTMWDSWKLIHLIGTSNNQFYTDLHHGPEGHDEQDWHHECHHGAAGQQYHHHRGPRAEHEPRRGQGLEDSLQWRHQGNASAMIPGCCLSMFNFSFAPFYFPGRWFLVHDKEIQCALI